MKEKELDSTDGNISLVYYLYMFVSLVYTICIQSSKYLY